MCCWWFDFTIDTTSTKSIIGLFRGVVCWSFILREVKHTHSVSQFFSLSHTHTHSNTHSQKESTKREDSGVEWSGVEWSGLQVTHVLSRERTKYHFTKPHTQYTTSVLFVFCSLSYCCCWMWIVFFRREKTQREEKRSFFSLWKCVQEFVGNTPFESTLRYYITLLTNKLIA
jgi:hypothetical protein